jgi:hypothetical protein
MYAITVHHIQSLTPPPPPLSHPHRFHGAVPPRWALRSVLAHPVQSQRLGSEPRTPRQRIQHEARRLFERLPAPPLGSGCHSTPRGCQIGHVAHTGCHQLVLLAYVILGLSLPGGVRLITWNIPVVINWMCFWHVLTRKNNEVKSGNPTCRVLHHPPRVQDPGVPHPPLQDPRVQRRRGKGWVKTPVDDSQHGPCNHQYGPRNQSDTPRE